MSHKTCTTVTLLKRPIKNGRLSLYLDYYPEVRNPETMKLTRREYLGIYIYARPKTAAEKAFNEEMLQKAEAIRNLRFNSLLNEQFGFFDRDKMQATSSLGSRKSPARNVIKSCQLISTSITSFMANVASSTSTRLFVRNSRPIS